MRLSSLTLLLALALNAFALPAFAQGEAFIPRVLVVDRDRAVRASTVGPTLRDFVVSERQRIEDWNKEQLTALRDESKALNDQRSSLSQEDFRAKSLEVNAKANKIRSEVVDAQSKLDRYARVQRAAILQSLNAVSLEVAAEQGVNMVLAKGAVIVMADDFDITDAAIERLNVTMPDLADLSKAADTE